MIIITIKRIILILWSESEWVFGRQDAALPPSDRFSAHGQARCREYSVYE